MKNIVSLLIIALLTVSCDSVQKLSATKNKNGNLVGIATKKHFQQEPYASGWFNKNYNNYKANKNTVSKLKPFLKDIKIKGFMGTWCGDSKREVPIFYKTLDETNFNYKNLELVTVNRQKTANGLEKGFKVERVPTFIFYKNGKEIGRFVEHTVNGNSLEGDLLKILSGEEYKHPYEK